MRHYSRYVLPAIFFILAITILFSTIVRCAQAAPDYATVGVSHSTLNHINGDGWWRQDNGGFETHEESTTTTGTLGLGWNLSESMAFELDWRDLGRLNLAGRYILDVDYNAGNYDIPTATVIVRQKVYGAGASFTYTEPVGKLKPFLRAGLFAAHTQFDYVGTWVKAPPHGGKRFEVEFHETHNRISPFVGAGIRYGDVFVEYNRFSRLGTDNSPANTASTWTVGLQSRF